jgi:hypothetical protein
MALLAALGGCTSGGMSWYQTFHLSTTVDLNLVLTSEAAHDGAVSSQLVLVGPVNIRGAEDCVAVAVEGNGDVLAATVSPDEESPGVVGVELGKWEVHDVELVSGGQCGGLVAGISIWFVSGWCVRHGKWCKAV